MKRVLPLLLLGCTDVGLYRAPGLGEGPIDNKLAIESRFCTEDPRRLNFPVKIMFVVDSSQSMLQTDPTGERLIAVQEVVDAFITDPGVEFAIVQFNGAVNVLTQDDDDGQDGFTRDYMDLQNAIVRLGIAEQPTDYEGALNAAQLVLARDMMKTDDDDLARSKYVIIFLSDGLPNPVVPPLNTRSAILDLVADIADLKRIFRPAEIRLHTALLLGAVGVGSRCTDDDLEGGEPLCQVATTAAACQGVGLCVWINVIDEATSLLTAMSELGNGTFRSFPNGEEINFLKIDFTSIRRVFTLKNLVATNTNARPSLVFEGSADRIGTADPDSDGDGLSDDDEALYGTDSALLDTDGDGFHDFLEVRLGASGFDPLDPSDADCTPGIDDFDSDGDGLLDCEERFVGTHKAFVDSDADGVADVIELRNGTNPAADDTRADLDFDAARNADEIRGHSDPVINDAADRSAIAYRYDVVERDLEDMAPDDPRVPALMEGRSCYDFRIENITLSGTDGGNNRVYVYVDQAPFDDPTDYGIFRVACVEQVFIHPDFRDPPYPEVEIPTDDLDQDGWPDAFRFPTDFDPDRDCTTGAPPPLEDE
jgi:hypothetical protein